MKHSTILWLIFNLLLCLWVSLTLEQSRSLCFCVVSFKPPLSTAKLAVTAECVSLCWSRLLTKLIFHFQFFIQFQPGCCSVCVCVSLPTLLFVKSNLSAWLTKTAKLDYGSCLVVSRVADFIPLARDQLNGRGPKTVPFFTLCTMLTEETEETE